MRPLERFFKVMTNRWIMLLYLSTVVIAFAYWDQPIALFFHEWSKHTSTTWLKILTELGLGGLYLPTLLLLALFFHYVYPHREWEYRTWFIWLCVFIPSVLCIFLKIVFGRARPDLLFSQQDYGFYWFQVHASHWSFPSGHTSTISGLVFGLAVVFPRYCYAFIVVGLMVAASRIVLTDHFLSDVLMAFYLALIEVGVLLHLLRRKGWLGPAYEDGYNDKLLSRVSN